MKILAITNVPFVESEKQSMVDRWRIYHPLEELRKHVDWQIDYQKSIIPGIEKYKSKEEFTDEELEKAAKKLGEYDIIFSSYHASPTAFSLLHVVNKRYGTKYVMDDDDDIFSIEPDNPFWRKMGHNEVFAMQRIVRLAPFLTIATPELDKVYSEKTEVEGKRYILPNAIPNRYKEYDPDNGENVVIGFFGGSAHYRDLHVTGALQAVEKIMHKHKNVRFRYVGVPITQYLPVARTEIAEQGHGDAWYDKVFPSLQFDISLAPLVENEFNKSKSNIKWQESTRMGAAVVASDMEPFRGLGNGISLVNNTQEAWFDALEKLVLDRAARKSHVDHARKQLEGMTLENNWQKYKDVFELINKEK